MNDDTQTLFLQAIEHAQREFYIDAIEAFQNLVETDPGSPLADDATFNLGLCYLKINQLDKARECFEKILSDYADGTIDPVPNQKEFGRTAAKALLALVELALTENDRSHAVAYADKLKEYEDSWVLVEGGQGEKVSFYNLAKKMIGQ